MLLNGSGRGYGMGEAVLMYLPLEGSQFGDCLMPGLEIASRAMRDASELAT